MVAKERISRLSRTCRAVMQHSGGIIHVAISLRWAPQIEITTFSRKGCAELQSTGLQRERLVQVEHSCTWALGEHQLGRRAGERLLVGVDQARLRHQRNRSAAAHPLCRHLTQNSTAHDGQHQPEQRGRLRQCCQGRKAPAHLGRWGEDFRRAELEQQLLQLDLNLQRQAHLVCRHAGGYI
jgi:hypothetical protein